MIPASTFINDESSSWRRRSEGARLDVIRLQLPLSNGVVQHLNSPHQPPNDFRMCLRLRLNPILPHRHKCIHILSKCFGMSIAEVGGDVREKVLREGWEGVRSFRWDGEEVGL